MNYYFLYPAGPCVPTNTACSSSLVAAHLAAQSLNSHVKGADSQAAIAAGVNAILVPRGASAAMTQARDEGDKGKKGSGNHSPY